jgi:hypothetical protein
LVWRELREVSNPCAADTEAKEDDRQDAARGSCQTILFVWAFGALCVQLPVASPFRKCAAAKCQATWRGYPPFVRIILTGAKMCKGGRLIKLLSFMSSLVCLPLLFSDCLLIAASPAALVQQHGYNPRLQREFCQD